MSFIQEGFAKLYTTSHLEAKLQPDPVSPWQAILSDMERDNLYDPVSVEEIKSTLWSIKAFKALGLDGLHVGFFQGFWMIVGGLVVEEIKKCFETKRKFLNSSTKLMWHLSQKFMALKPLGIIALSISAIQCIK